MARSHAFWQDKCVVISGASSGIGRALAEQLAPQGARLALIARRADRLAELAASIRAGGQQASYAQADVTSVEATQAAVQTLEDQLGACDVLIANAGVYRKTDVRNFDPRVANEVLATNVQGVVNAVAAVLPGMVQRQRGHIAAVGSVAAMIGLPAAGAYCASKAAVVALLESLRLDLHPLGVKVTTVCPGYVDTAMITDEERVTLKDLISAEEAARRICRAVERGVPECWFPRRTWLLARLARTLPWSIYRRVISQLDEMEEAESQDA